MQGAKSPPRHTHGHRAEEGLLVPDGAGRLTRGLRRCVWATGCAVGRSCLRHPPLHTHIRGSLPSSRDTCVPGALLGAEDAVIEEPVPRPHWTSRPLPAPRRCPEALRCSSCPLCGSPLSFRPLPRGHPLKGGSLPLEQITARGEAPVQPAIFFQSICSYVFVSETVSLR